MTNIRRLIRLRDCLRMPDTRLSMSCCAARKEKARKMKGVYCKSTKDLIAKDSTSMCLTCEGLHDKKRRGK